MIDIRLGDCLELMKTLPDNSVDLICTDPPYMMTSAACDQMKIDIPAISEQFRRIAKPHAAWVVFGQTKSIVDWIVTNRKLFKYSLVWNKCAVSGFLDANVRPLRVYELINIFCDGKMCYNPQKTKGEVYVKKRNGSSECYNHFTFRIATISDGYRFPIDILNFPIRESGNQTPVQEARQIDGMACKNLFKQGRCRSRSVYGQRLDGRCLRQFRPGFYRV